MMHITGWIVRFALAACGAAQSAMVPAAAEPLLGSAASPNEKTLNTPTHVDFETQIIPLFTKAGCNSGACHGAAIGRGGFRLSLLGYDPTADYESLTNEFEGRRVNRAYPEKSLVLRKPTMQLEHGGGLRLTEGGAGFQLLHDWIANGAPRAPARRLKKLEIVPDSQWVARPGGSFDVQVIAIFERVAGSTESGDEAGGDFAENVTRWAVLQAADPAALKVGPGGTVTATRPGQHVAVVRYLGEVASVMVNVPIGSDRGMPLERRRSNFVDDFVNQTLDALRLPSSDRCDDRAFARRVFLDLTGTLPEPSEVDAFVRASSDEKRQRLVDELLDRTEFADFWSQKWGDLYRIESKRLQKEGAEAFHHWVRAGLSGNRPFDVMAREMLLATGDAYAVGPANFTRVPTDARGHAEHVSRVFLGVRLQCANCHNHPLDRWTQDDYHGLAAIFARLDRGREVRPLPRGDVIHPRTGQPAPPRIPGADTPLARPAAAEDEPNGDLVSTPSDRRRDATPVATTGQETGAEPALSPRETFAAWLTASDNPYFARAAVNRVWRELMGRGLVEPTDDHRATNPPSHPELLDALAQDFAEHEYDLKRLIRVIVSSDAYQRTSNSVPGNESDDRFYSKYLVRPLPPEVLVDAVSKVTGIPEVLGQLPAGTRAISLGDSRVPSQSLDLLGRCARDSECAATPSAAGSLALALHVINGSWLNSKITDPSGRLAGWIEAQRSDKEIVELFFHTALSRPPTEVESQNWIRELSAAPADERNSRLQDFLWALLNSIEFRCNH